MNLHFAGQKKRLSAPTCLLAGIPRAYQKAILSAQIALIPFLIWRCTVQKDPYVSPVIPPNKCIEFKVGETIGAPGLATSEYVVYYRRVDPATLTWEPDWSRWASVFSGAYFKERTDNVVCNDKILFLQSVIITTLSTYGTVYFIAECNCGVAKGSNDSNPFGPPGVMQWHLKQGEDGGYELVTTVIGNVPKNQVD